jgi:hypothetical protein
MIINTGEKLAVRTPNKDTSKYFAWSRGRPLAPEPPPPRGVQMGDEVVEGLQKGPLTALRCVQLCTVVYSRAL